MADLNSVLSLKQRLTFGTFWSTGGSLLAQLLNIATSIVTARLLDQSAFGQFGLIGTTITAAGVFAGFGLGVTATREIAARMGGDKGRAGNILAMLQRAAIFTGLVLMLISFAAMPWISSQFLHARHLGPLLQLASISLLFNAMAGVQVGALAGLEAFQSIALLNTARWAVSFLAIVGGSRIAALEGAVAGMVVASFAAWLSGEWILRRKARDAGLVPRYTGIDRSVLIRFSLPAFLAGVVTEPAMWLASAFLAGQPDGYRELGIFTAANQWRSAIIFLPAMAGSVSLSLLSQLHGAGEEFRYRLLLRQLIRTFTLLSGAAAVIVAILSPLIMEAYGKEYGAEWPTLVVLSVAAMLMGINGVVGNVILSRGKPTRGLIYNSLWAAVFLTIAYFSVAWGAFGLALAFLGAYVAHTLWQSAYVISFSRGTGS